MSLETFGFWMALKLKVSWFTQFLGSHRRLHPRKIPVLSNVFKATRVINRTQIYANNAQYTCIIFILVFIVANNAS